MPSPMIRYRGILFFGLSIGVCLVYNHTLKVCEHNVLSSAQLLLRWPCSAAQIRFLLSSGYHF